MGYDERTLVAPDQLIDVWSADTAAAVVRRNIPARWRCLGRTHIHACAAGRLHVHQVIAGADRAGGDLGDNVGFGNGSVHIDRADVHRSVSRGDVHQVIAGADRTGGDLGHRPTGGNALGQIDCADVH